MIYKGTYNIQPINLIYVYHGNFKNTCPTRQIKMKQLIKVNTENLQVKASGQNESIM